MESRQQSQSRRLSFAFPFPGSGLVQVQGARQNIVSVRAQLTAGMLWLPGFALALLWDHGTHGLDGARRAAARHVKPARRRH